MQKLWPVAILILLLVFPTTCFAQDKKIVDSLNMKLKEYEATGNDSRIIAILSRLSIAYQSNDPAKAMEFAKKQLSLARLTEDKWGIASAYNMLGAMNDHKGEYKLALDYYFKARLTFTQIGRKLDVLDVNNNIGVIYAKKGVYAEALRYMLMALDIATKEKDNFGIITTYNNIGLVYEGQKQPDEALKYYLKCLTVQKKLGKGHFIQTTLVNIGNMYRQKNQPETALKYYAEGIKHSVAEYDKLSLANNYGGTGSAYTDRKEWDKALENNFKALEIRKSIDDTYGLVSSYLALGEIYLQTGDYPKALTYTSEAGEIVKRTKELNFQAEIYRQLSKIHESMGNAVPALQNYKLFKTYNDSIFNAENSKKLTEQQMNFDFKLIQEKKDAAAKQALKDQKNIRNYSIAGLFLIAIFTIIILRQRYKLATIRKQKAHDAAMHKLENEIALKDLESEALRVENENILLKEEKLQQKLTFNERELASATMYLYQKNEMLSGLQKQLNDVPVSASLPEKSIRKIKETIQSNLYLDADWEKFKVHFEKVHPDFFKNLREKHPGLTQYEVRLAAYFHIELSTKEIAALLNINPTSVHKAKSRLNKKLSSI